jgi:hypothetical protein
MKYLHENVLRSIRIGTVSSVALDYALHTLDEPRDNPFDIDKAGISCAIPSGWPGSFSDISCSSCIVFFSRYASWLVGTLFLSNTSDSLHGDYTGKYSHNVSR